MGRMKALFQEYGQDYGGPSQDHLPTLIIRTELAQTMSKQLVSNQKFNQQRRNTMSVTDITAAKKEKVDNVSLSVTIPETLYDKIKLDSIICKKSIGITVEEMADKFVSLQDVTIGLATLMNHTPAKEKVEPGVAMKNLTIPVSRRHHNLIKMEALRQNTTVRSLLKGWLQANTREWYVEPGDHEESQQQAA